MKDFFAPSPQRSRRLAIASSSRSFFIHLLTFVIFIRATRCVKKCARYSLFWYWPNLKLEKGTGEFKLKNRWQKSRELLTRAQGSLVGGVSSPFRAKFPVPLYLTEGWGSRVRDVDGNEYIDYTLAWGPLILGHRHPKIREAILGLADHPIIYGAQHEIEYLVAEKIQRLVPCAERVAFTSSGSEAVQLALRLARAFTNRNLIVKFEGHYHGWMDFALLSYHPGLAEGDPMSLPTWC